MEFTLHQTDVHTRARLGTLSTPHGTIDTPVFMPVGTAGSVKAVHSRELVEDIHAQIILGNTYHLYLRPGTDLLEQAGGLHRFMAWPGPILTDSGGYQVYSLAERRKLSDEGVTFRSHIDGSAHVFTPESVIAIQRSIGSDIMMALDECTPFPCDKSYTVRSMKMTHAWLDRCIRAYHRLPSRYNYEQALFPIVQGGTYPELRKEAALIVAEKDLPGNAIGGLSVGEPVEMMYDMTALVCEVLPAQKPRYLMGVGTPENLLECIALGVDMFDCVMPTRNARNGMLFTSGGVINIRNEKWKNDLSPIDPVIGGYVSTTYTKAYLRHLIMSKEILGAQIASIHNLAFYQWLMKEARKVIALGSFGAWKAEMVKKVAHRC